MNDYDFGISPVSEENLRGLAHTLTKTAERRILELRDIAEACADLSQRMLRDGFEAYEVISLMAEEISLDLYQLSPIHLPEHKQNLTALLSELSGFDKAAFSSAYLDIMRRRGESLDERSFLISGDVGGMITYVKNPFSDEAFDVFSEELDSPTLKYAATMREAAASVLDGDAVYCLLPLEERGVRIASVSDLIFSFDLKINSVTSVFGPDGSADMKYALLSSGYRVPDISEGDDSYLELRLAAYSTDTLAELTSAVLSLSHTIYRINTEPMSTDSEASVSLVIRDGGEGFTALLVFLALFYPSCNIIGMYKNLE